MCPARRPNSASAQHPWPKLEGKIVVFGAIRETKIHCPIYIELQVAEWTRGCRTERQARLLPSMKASRFKIVQ